MEPLKGIYPEGQGVNTNKKAKIEIPVPDPQKSIDKPSIPDSEIINDNRIIALLKNSRGLSHFLNGFQLNQKDIVKFVQHCKFHENRDGFLSQSFFDITKKSKVKFISGPFTQMFFNIIEGKGKKIKGIINNINLTISKKSNNFLFS